MAAEATLDELLKDGTCTVQDAEREFGFKKSRLYAWMQDGTQPYSQVGDRRYLPRGALEANCGRADRREGNCGREVTHAPRSGRAVAN